MNGVFVHSSHTGNWWTELTVTRSYAHFYIFQLLCPRGNHESLEEIFHQSGLLVEIISQIYMSSNVSISPGGFSNVLVLL